MFQLTHLILFLFATISTANAVRLQDYQPYDYEVRFTNPVCGEYVYPEPVESNSGNPLTAKPRHAYCTSADLEPSAIRDSSVQTKLLEWINAPTTREIFMAYLSFSNRVVADALCQAVRERGVKITFVLDSGTGLELARELEACEPPAGSGSARPQITLRGNTENLGYAHNKLFIVNPSSPDAIKIGFSSGNMSPGVVTHHENWNFITTSVNSYFAQVHLCVIDGMINHAQNKAAYKTHIAGCRATISAAEEDDIKTFFVPGEGVQATEALKVETSLASSVWVAAHRLSNTKIKAMLSEKLTAEPNTNVRLLTDDDTYWAGHGQTIGANRPNEYRFIKDLLNIGAQARFMETNHFERQLHHNKFMVFQKSDSTSVFAGAGNFTNDAFDRNFENFYMIKIPDVAEKFRVQYEHLWGTLATATENLPERIVRPQPAN